MPLKTCPEPCYTVGVTDRISSTKWSPSIVWVIIVTTPIIIQYGVSSRFYISHWKTKKKHGLELKKKKKKIKISETVHLF